MSGILLSEGSTPSTPASGKLEVYAKTDSILYYIKDTGEEVALTGTAISTPPVRQTVLSGPVDTSGFSAFGGSTGSTTVTASGTLTATAANGTSDRLGTVTNPSWTGLSTNGTMYLYLDIAADETCTTGSTTVAPNYRWGGADVTTNNQFTFNIQEMQGKVGNGSVATQTYRVFVGEVTVSGSVVTVITWYALMGRYDSGYTATLPGTSTSVTKSHNIGVIPFNLMVIFECTTTDANYSVGDVVYSPFGTGAYGSNSDNVIATTSNKLSCGFSNGPTNAFTIYNKTGGSNTTLTAASWKYKLVASRGW